MIALCVGSATPPSTRRTNGLSSTSSSIPVSSEGELFSLAKIPTEYSPGRVKVVVHAIRTKPPTDLMRIRTACSASIAALFCSWDIDRINTRHEAPIKDPSPCRGSLVCRNIVDSIDRTTLFNNRPPQLPPTPVVAFFGCSNILLPKRSRGWIQNTVSSVATAR
eukprot:scaffold54086_cov27-Tisochrysis_lutea.AAC.6